MFVAGLRFDTSGQGRAGTRWQARAALDRRLRRAPHPRPLAGVGRRLAPAPARHGRLRRRRRRPAASSPARAACPTRCRPRRRSGTPDRRQLGVVGGVADQLDPAAPHRLGERQAAVLREHVRVAAVLLACSAAGRRTPRRARWPRGCGMVRVHVRGRPARAGRRARTFVVEGSREALERLARRRPTRTASAWRPLTSSSSAGLQLQLDAAVRRAARARSPRVPISSATISRWRSSTRSMRAPSTDRIRSSGRIPARSAGLPSTTSTTSTQVAEPGRGAGLRRQRARAAGDAEVGAAHAAVATSAPAITRWVASLIGTARPRPDAGDGGVDAHHAAAAVGERAAGVARVERGVGLDHVVDDARRPGASARAASVRAPRRRRPSPSRRGRAGCRSPRRAGRRAAARRRRARPAARSLALGAQHGEVRERVAADHLEALLAAVGEGARARGRSSARRRGPR